MYYDCYVQFSSGQQVSTPLMSLQSFNQFMYILTFIQFYIRVLQIQRQWSHVVFREVRIEQSPCLHKLYFQIPSLERYTICVSSSVNRPLTLFVRVVSLTASHALLKRVPENGSLSWWKKGIISQRKAEGKRRILVLLPPERCHKSVL